MGPSRVFPRNSLDSFNKWGVIIFRFLEANFLGGVCEKIKIMAQSLHIIPGPEYGFANLSGGNQVDGSPPASDIMRENIFRKRFIQ